MGGRLLRTFGGALVIFFNCFRRGRIIRRFVQKTTTTLKSLKQQQIMCEKRRGLLDPVPLKVSNWKDLIWSRS